MKKNIIFIIVSFVVLSLVIVSWILLPNEVAVQIGFDGEVSNTMPKAFAIIIPFLVSLFGLALTYTDLLRDKEKDNKNNKTKGLVILIIGIAIMILTLVFNL